MPQRISKQANLFFIWGIITVAFNVALFKILFSVMGINFQLANFIDWFFTVLFSFVVNRKFVFKSTSNTIIRELGPFFGTRVLSFVVELFLLWLFLSELSIDPVLSKLLGHTIALVINYYLSKFVFTKI